MFMPRKFYYSQHYSMQFLVKVQRGWKSIKTPIAEGMRIQYNFVKPHMALNGQTPSEVSGIVIQDKNKWLGLIRKAYQNTSELRNS